MDKVDLIYDTVCRIEQQNIKRFELIEKDIAEIKKWKSTLIGYCGGVTLVSTFIMSIVKDIFIR